MKKITYYSLILFALVNFSLAAQTNIASSATVSTSYISPWETLSAINNGVTPANSADNSTGAYGNWSGEANYGIYNYVEYSWTSSQNLSSTQVYWWDDNVGIDQPTDAYIQYWDGSAWITAGGIGLALNQWNSIPLNVSTTGIRIYMKSAMATGVLEWEAYDGGTICEPTAVTPWANINNTGWAQTNTVVLDAGGTFTLGAQPAVDGYTWTGPNNFTASVRDITFNNVTTNIAGTYIATYTNDCGTQTSKSYYVTVNNTSTNYTWPSYNPTISYNFNDDYGPLNPPSTVLDDCAGVVGTQTSDWWCFRWGSNANSLVTSAAITPMLERFETDFSYFTDVMGWPRDTRAQNGYKSGIYLFGSGLCTDAADNTALGGWMGSIYYSGQNWPMVLASYYPVYSFDPACPYGDKLAQQGAMVHEGIHSLLAGLPGCRDAAWFHEGGNTWLQQEAESRRSGLNTSMGFLNAGAMIAPFMPIECYSGWLQDGSFGGPAAEGVNMFNGSQQICTWKGLLGGTQYGNMFPTILAHILGDGSIPWIWKNCTSRVLEGMSAALGDTQMRHLICEYRAKQAVVDLGVWTNATIALLDGNMGASIEEEWTPCNIDCAPWTATPYVETTNNNGTLTPATWTLPGWSGANQIPLTVSGTSATINFQPIGANMRCQMCYIGTDGSRVYSQVVSSGDCTINFNVAPANNVVIAVITNTDYIYEGEATRFAKFDYRLSLGNGIIGTADIHSRWYKGSNLKSAVSGTYNFYDVSKYCSHSHSLSKKNATIELQEMENTLTSLYPNPVSIGENITIHIAEEEDYLSTVQFYDMQGKLVLTQQFFGEINVNSSDLQGKGVFMVRVSYNNKNNFYKLIVK